MTEYLVELYSITANPDSAALARLDGRNGARYLRSIVIPGDETCLHLLEAHSSPGRLGGLAGQVR